MAARTHGEVRFCTGWKLFIFRACYIISLVKYLVQRRKYALFSLKFLKDHRKGQIQELPKVPRFGRYYYPNILNIPPLAFRGL